MAGVRPVSALTITAAYRWRLRIDASSTKSTRHDRLRRRAATADHAPTRALILCQPILWRRATWRIAMTPASATSRRASRLVTAPSNSGRPSKNRPPQPSHAILRRRHNNTTARPDTSKSRTLLERTSWTDEQANPHSGHPGRPTADSTSTTRSKGVSDTTPSTRT